MIELIVDKSDQRELEADMRALEPSNLIGPELGEFGRSVVQVVSTYPAEPAGSTYQRTGLLARSWLYSLLPGAAQTEIGIKNAASYAGYVQGDEQTERHAQTGWRRILDVVEDEADKLVERLEKKAGRLWDDRPF